MSDSMKETASSLSKSGKIAIIVAAFLGWFFAGMHLGITSLAMGSASKDLLKSTGQYEEVVTNQNKSDANPTDTNQTSGSTPAQNDVEQRLKTDSSKWFGYYVCALLFGGALGGLVFGRIGDEFGRVKGMMAAICCYSGVSALAYFVETPEQLWIARFVVCMGVGGMWPNGVALMSEAWASASRPLLAGVIGTAANIGIFMTGVAGRIREVSPEDWRWVMLMGAVPIVLGVLVPLLVPESPRWLEDQRRLKGEKGDADDSNESKPQAVTTKEIFTPPLLTVTLVGILLATVPLFGGWGSSNWAVKWAEDAGSDGLKAQVIMARSLTGIIGSFLGGWVASLIGRRRSYFLNSLICLASAQCLFWFTTPTDATTFLIMNSVLGFFSGIFFGWLPLFLPELFVTRVRSAGAGVCFNFGRIITAITVFITAALIAHFNNDFQAIGRLTSLIYLLGAVGILLMPKGVEGEIKD
ncbi:MAG: MFS transporter [Verrucomicrobiota bacterium]|nr:MFS transporter [Verrucomicrobiota bacterium]